MANISRSDLAEVALPYESDTNVLLAAKGGSIVFLGSMFGYASQLVIGILLTRFLGAELYGQYKVAVIAGEMAASFAILGLDCAMVRFISLFASRRDTAGLWGTVQIGVGITVLVSLLIGAGLFFLATPLALHIFKEPQLVPLLRLASLIVPLSALTNIFGSATMGFNKMQYNAGARSIAQPLTRILILIPLVLIGLTCQNAIAAYITGLIVSCALLLYFLDRLFSLRRPLQSARRDNKEILLFSLPAYLSTLINTFGPSLQTVLLGSLNTMATVGIFSAANQVSTASTLFNSSIGTASSPIVSGLYAQEDKGPMAHFYQTTAKWMFMVNLPMFLVVLLLSAPILKIFGNEFVEGSSALIILALANLVIAAAGISDGVLAMTGYTSLKMVNSIIQAIFTLGLCFLFIPRWGAVGAALAVFVSYTVIHLLLVIEVFVLFHMLPYTLSFLKPVIAGLVAITIGWFTRQLLHVDTRLILAILNAAIVFGIYIGMILLLGVSSEDRAVLNQFRRNIISAVSRK
jgi:O-antigen/teichoic acid export membrane protein